MSLRHDMQRHGEANGRAKLSREEVTEIWQEVAQRDKLQAEIKALMAQLQAKRRAAKMLNNSALARRMGVSEFAVRSILYGQTWAQATTKRAARYGVSQMSTGCAPEPMRVIPCAAACGESPRAG